MDVLNSDFRCKWPSKNNFSELDISQSLVWQCPSLSPYFLLLISTGPVCCFNRIFRLKPFVSILFCLDVRCNDLIQRLNFSAFLKLP